MSQQKVGQVRCNGCGVSSEFEYYASVNVSIDPELKPRLLNGDLFTFRCAECGQAAEVRYDLLYNDMDRRLFVWLKHRQGNEPPHVPEAEEAMKAAPRIFKRLSCRVVGDRNELVEKVRIVDDGYDDVAVELVKFFLSESQDIEARLYYDRTETADGGERQFVFVYWLDGEYRAMGYDVEPAYTAGRQFAEKILPALQERMGRCLWLSRETVAEALEGSGLFHDQE